MGNEPFWEIDWDILGHIFHHLLVSQARWAGPCRDRANDVTQFWARWFQPIIPKLSLTPPVSQSHPQCYSTGHISSNILGIVDPLSYLFGYPGFILKTTGKKHMCIYIYIHSRFPKWWIIPISSHKHNFCCLNPNFGWLNPHFDWFPIGKISKIIGYANLGWVLIESFGWDPHFSEIDKSKTTPGGPPIQSKLVKLKMRRG